MKYEPTTFLYEDIKNDLIKPKFQRHFIWNDDKKKSLVDTIKRQLPIGSILLAKKISSEGDKYLIIDGLQRISTLNEVLSDPFKYIGEAEVDDDKLRNILQKSNPQLFENTFKRYSDSQQRSLLDTLRNDLIKALSFKTHTTDLQHTFQIRDVILSETYLSDKDSDQVLQVVSDFILNLKSLLNVDKLKIPAIVFNGSENSRDLATVFEKVNQGGVKLSKYDTFAASWQDITISVKGDSSLIENVIDKYDYAEENESLIVDGFDKDEIREDGIINIYEYAYSIGKVIGKHSKFIFKHKSVEQVDSFGFNLINSVFGNKNSEISDLGDIIRSYPKFNFINLKNSLLDIIDDVESRMSSFIEDLDSFSKPVRNKKYYFDYKEFQVISFIVTGFRLKYEITDSGPKTLNNLYARQYKSFLQYLPVHYLFDNLRSKWGNAGDTELDNLMSIEINSVRYLSKPIKENFISTTSAWLEESNSTHKKTIDTFNKLFLNYLLRSKKQAEDYKGGKMNFDHIVPQKRLAAFVSEYPNYPLSTACNLVIIPEYGNKSKRELTFYQWIESGERNVELKTDELVNNYLYPPSNELGFVKSEETFTYNNYINFLKDRKNYLLKMYSEWFDKM